MPSKQSVNRQRALGGGMGIMVLAFALAYHFFPRLFHVNPDQQRPRQNAIVMPSGPTSGPAKTAPAMMTAAQRELTAGPPLTLAPTAVIAARLRKQEAALPKQLTADPPAVKALLARADQAMKDGDLAGDDNSAGILYAKALKLKSDSRAAAEGLDDVRSNLIATIGQDIAMGDADSAGNLLAGLKQLPGTHDDVQVLAANLKTLQTVRPILAKAAGLLAQGKADLPKGASALDLYRQVQQLDPDNAVAAQGILQVQRAVLNRALAAVAQNDFIGADKALNEAQAIQPDSPQLQSVRGQVDGIRKQRVDGVLAQARSALDAGNLTLAKQLADQAQAIGTDPTGVQAIEEGIVNARLYASHKPGEVFTDRYVDLPGHSPAMVVVPTGSFTMGASSNNNGKNDAETPQHEVTITKGFAMSRSAITVAQFRQFVKASGYVPDSVRLGGASVYDARSGTMRDDSNATWQDNYEGRPADGNLPVVNISWNDAEAYVAWLSRRTGKTYRLPSEAEFEYALRAGTTTRYWWGDGTPTEKVENITGSLDRSSNGRRWSHAFHGYRDGYWGPAPVMSFKPNPFGLYDMDGNVSEWVADCWHDNYIRAPNNGSAWINPGCTAHVIRGGSWGSSPAQVRSSYRQGADSDVRSGRVGFRVVREL
ncbi:SUMF1/EgtB/PvdO family nonheme iron enzyme [Dyella sp. A6]|uniref:SUMF1/EgtB/PvdO family nonheme iron enzyme n=1 Tax=Dyella aluminiiresistens TaxID=3069105 RepID=UPI002E79FF9B|nr:SUMF1/EgtB/PvdO family nonheme iron enzyme [Dyella sp. A6]